MSGTLPPSTPRTPDPVTVPVTVVRLNGSADRAELPLLVLAPAAGVSATALWVAASTSLTDRFDVLAWDLPGQGYNQSVPAEPYADADLARGVLEVVDEVLEQRGERGASFGYGEIGTGIGAVIRDVAPGRIAVLVSDVPDPRDDSSATAAHVRRVLLGEEPAADDPRVALAAALSTIVESAIGSGLSSEQVAEVLDGVAERILGRPVVSAPRRS